MASNLGIPPSGKQHRGDAQVIITSTLPADQAVDDHFTKSMGGQVQTSQWTERNLPVNFFEKPSGKSSANTSVAHSRDGSADSSRFTMSPPAAFTNGGLGSVAAAVGSAAIAGSIQHSRTQSSPATLNTHMSLPPSGPYVTKGNRAMGPTMSAATPVGRQQHKHRSVDTTLDADTAQLPYGWERKFTENGQPFYVNSIDKTTTWDDPRKSLSASNLSQATIVCSAQNQNAAMSATNLGPMPAGWEEAVTPTGEKYYINHNDKTTSWYDPRLPEEVQKPMIVQRLISQPHGQRQVGGPCAMANPNNQPMRYGHQHQTANARAQLPSHTGVGRSIAAGAASFSPMIQELNQERLSILKRNLEIRDQGLLDRLSPVHPLSPGQNVGNDAFLGVAGPTQYASGSMMNHNYPASTSDYHIRQESSDSGLGMPIGYPHTPDNYLGNSDIDLSFSGINLIDSAMQMDVDPTNIPATLDNLGIAPNDLDQYLNPR